MKNSLPAQNLKRTFIFGLLFLLIGITNGYGQKVTVDKPLGGFEIDGDLIGNTLTGDFGGDWLPGESFGSVFDLIGNPLNPATSFRVMDPATGNDTVFSGGDKVNDYIADWGWTTGS